MIKNDLKEKLGKDWRSKFAHRDCDQANYEFGEFEIDGKKIGLVLNPDTLDIMDYYYDDFNEWIEIDNNNINRLSSRILKIGRIPRFKIYVNNRYEMKTNKKSKKLSKKIHSRHTYPTVSIHSTTIKTHKLIAIMFVPNPNPEKYNMINHINRIRTDFRKENLEWCDSKWNSKKENRENRENSSNHEYKYLAINPTTNNIEYEWFNCASCPFPTLSSNGYKYWNSQKKYKGYLLKKVNISLEDYISRHPIDPNGWFVDNIHMFTNHTVRANICGILEIDGELRVGTLDNLVMQYRISIDGMNYLTHRLIYEIISGELIKSDLVIDHKIPVSSIDVNNEFSNLQKVTQKENMNNTLTIAKRLIKIFIFDSFGNFKNEFKSVNDASNYLSAPSGSIVSAAKGKNLMYKNYIVLYTNDQKEINNRLKYVYFKYDSNGNILESSWSFKILYNSNENYKIAKLKYLNTGIPAPDGYYYQQGDPKNLIYDSTNIKLKKKRPMISWGKR